MYFSELSRMTALAVYLPEESISTKELVAGCVHQPRLPLQHMTGIERVRTAALGDSALKMAEMAAVRCLEATGVPRDTIDLLICATIFRTDGERKIVWEPNASTVLRGKLGLDRAIVFDLGNACAGMWTAMLMADAMIAAGSCRRCLIVSGEYMTPMAQTAQREINSYEDRRVACLTLGDSGAAVLLEKSSPSRSNIRGEIYTLGKFQSACMAYPASHSEGGLIMHTDSVTLAAAVLDHGPSHAAEICRKLAVSGEVDVIIPHQTSVTSISNGAKRTNQIFGREVFRDDNVLIGLKQFGNTASTSHFVAMADAAQEGRLNDDQQALFAISGSGLTIGTALCNLGSIPTQLHTKGIDPESMAELTSPAPSLPMMAGSITAATPLGRIESIGLCNDPNLRSTVELARAAVNDCFANSEYTPQEIDVLIFGGVYRSACIIEPAIACILAGQLAINPLPDAKATRKTLAFDLFHGEGSFLTACRLSRDILSTNQARRILIVQCEADAPKFKAELRQPIATVGSAVIIDRDPGEACGFTDWESYWNGSEIDSIRVATLLSGRADDFEVQVAPEYRDYATRLLTHSIQAFLGKRGIDTSHLAAIVLPQDSSDSIRRIAADLDARCPVIDACCPNESLFTSSLPFALRHVADQLVPKNGKPILLTSVSPGLQVLCALYRMYPSDSVN